MFKESIENFYEKLSKEWRKANNSSPLVPFNEKWIDLFIGEQDEEGYIGWKITEKKEKLSKDFLNSKLGFVLHEDLYELYNSYYFLDLKGYLGNDEVSIDGHCPGVDYFSFISERSNNLEINKLIGKIRYIQIGYYINQENEYYLCFDNDSGKVLKYDFGNQEIEFISNSIEELLIEITPRYI